MKLAFLMDPIEDVNIDADTTFALMFAAQQKGHQIFVGSHLELYADNRNVKGLFRAIELRREKGNHFTYLSETQDLELTQFTALFMRTDPPFDLDYLHAVHLLGLAQEAGLTVINHPDGLRVANEKLYALHFESVIPRTLVTSHKSAIIDFVSREPNQTAILKPVDGHGGDGVVVLRQGDSNINALIELTTDYGRRRAIVQQLIPEAKMGDKRILLLDGEPLGAILRVPGEGEHRGNLHVGGRAEKTEITVRDREIIETLKERIKRDRLYFVGIDILGDYLTEVNVTSPTGIQEMSRFDDRDYAGQVIEFVEDRWGKE